MGLNNKTASDAFARIVEARMGSGVHATDDFILELKRLLLLWVDDLDIEMTHRMIKAEATARLDAEKAADEEFEKAREGREQAEAGHA